jgi:aldehyde:ferredoxin oxidoreductase
VDTESAILANYLCNDLGMDTISAGHVVSWAMETFERGLISEADTGGIQLNFGNAEALHTLLPQIGHRQGAFADMLAQGTRHASEQVGGDSYQWAIQAKGLEQSCVDTRNTMGYGLAFAVNPRGPDHLMTQPISEFGESDEARAVIREILGDEKYADPTITEKKPEMVRWHEDVYAVTDAVGFCIFVSIGPIAVKREDIAELLSLAFDEPISVEDLMVAGRRIVTIERCFNVREGGLREEDKLPWRMMNDPVPDGPTKGMVMDQKKLDGLLDEYYTLHGWDLPTAVPLRSTLEALGLLELCGDVAK